MAKPGGGGGRLAAGLAAGGCAEGAGATPERAKLEGQVALETKISYKFQMRCF